MYSDFSNDNQIIYVLYFETELVISVIFSVIPLHSSFIKSFIILIFHQDI
ncbi:MAG: hypothetical protein P1U46_04495 [Patescibacteria group bacterium]|nr:hypothetical protein [Patescibacteria group bacterium]